MYTLALGAQERGALLLVGGERRGLRPNNDAAGAAVDHDHVAGPREFRSAIGIAASCQKGATVNPEEDRPATGLSIIG